jgi:hypothetical protein
MKLSLYAKHGLFDELALAPSRESLPDHHDWSLSRKDAVDSEELMPNQQESLQRDGFILGRREAPWSPV